MNTNETSDNNGDTTWTIQQTVFHVFLGAKRNRLARLEAMQAPEIMLSNARGHVERLEAGTFKVGGMAEFGARRVRHSEWRKGQGGRDFLWMATDEGTVIFSPNSKFGPSVFAANRPW